MTAGFFTGVQPSEYDLPHPRIPLPVILVVRRVLLRAFSMLRERGFPFATAQEDAVTIALCGIIENDLRQKKTVPGFSRRTFEAVIRHAPVENYNFTKPQKAPDICFKLRCSEEPVRVLSTHHALFVECKPVDKDHAAGGAYCDKGLQRFVDGDYAWAMQDALMLGYVRHGRTIDKHLLKAMSESERCGVKLKVVELPQLVRGTKALPEAEALYCSRHGRGFPWPSRKGSAVDIFVYHSWHDCS